MTSSQSRALVRSHTELRRKLRGVIATMRVSPEDRRIWQRADRIRQQLGRIEIRIAKETELSPLQ